VLDGALAEVRAAQAEPLPPGQVGLVVTTYQTTRASLAELDDFVVEQMA